MAKSSNKVVNADIACYAPFWVACATLHQKVAPHAMQVTTALSMHGEAGMDEKFHRLSELGAGDFEHLDGSLIEHLRGTRKLLENWSAPEVLRDAGLYHAAYGTSGFDENLVSISQRSEIAQIIGREAEEIVYQYCACDRKHFFAQIGVVDNPEFKNRFTGELYQLSSDLMLRFCELTAANETEIAIDNPDFIVEHGSGLNRLFIRMAPYLSEAAKVKTAIVFGGKNA